MECRLNSGQKQILFNIQGILSSDTHNAYNVFSVYKKMISSS